MSEDEYKLRAHSTMKAFTFYLDDVTKYAVLQKLHCLGIDTKKGSLSALIRVLLYKFATEDIPIEELEDVIEQVNKEYLFTTKKNKRSTL